MSLSFPHTVTHHKKRTRKGELIGSEEELIKVEEGVTAWVQKPSAAVAQQFEKQSATISHVIYYESAPTLDESYVVEFNGAYLEVVSKPLDATAGLEKYYKVGVMENTGRWSGGVTSA